MNEISRAIKKPYLFSFLCLFIFFACSDIHASAEKQAPAQILLEITILDKTSDQPIPGAKVNVRVIQENGGDIREEKLTDENGKCVFPIEDKNIEVLRLNAVKNGHTPIQMSLSASETQQKISTKHTLYLDKGTKIGGLVQNVQGNPIEDVVVSISLQSSNRNDTSIISFELHWFRSSSSVPRASILP